MFNYNSVKVFLVLVVFSLFVFMALQQYLRFTRVAIYPREPSKKPSRVRNHIILQNSKSPQGSSVSSFETNHGSDGSYRKQSELDPFTGTSLIRNISVSPEQRAFVHNDPDRKQKPPNSSTSGMSNSVHNNILQQTSPGSSVKRPRLPKALIIGFSKCGTAALRTFLTIHPDVVSPIPELRYFTLYHSKGLEWYRKQMPPSTEQQLTIEKTPSYIMTIESLQRIHEYNPKVKLIVIVRDPIIRMQSEYAHVSAHTEEMPPFKKFWSEKPHDRCVINFSNYADDIRQVYDLFPKDQLLVLSEDDMERDPLSVLKEAEEFLQLRPAFTNDMFVFDKTKGFHCFNTRSKLFPRVLRLVQVNRFTGCLGRDKGREHPEIGEEYMEHLREVIRPLNEDLFELIGKRFEWDNFKETKN